MVVSGSLSKQRRPHQTRPLTRRGVAVAPFPHRCCQVKQCTNGVIRISILIVEDDPLIGLSLAEIVRSECGAPVGPVATSEDALSALKERKVDGALLDIVRRGETVFRLADVLRQQNIPFVFMIGHVARPNVPSRFSDVPILEKPCTAPEILSLLKAEIQRHSADA